MNLTADAQLHIATAVQRSAAVMDEVQPAWFLVVDGAVLDIDDPLRCIVGQVWPGYDYTGVMLGTLRPQFDETFGEAEQDGWASLPHADWPDGAGFMERCWRDEIAARQEIDTALRGYGDVLLLP